MPFKPGQSGNPAGRHKGATQRLYEAIRKVIALEALKIIQSIVTAAAAGDLESERLFLAPKSLPNTRPPNAPHTSRTQAMRRRKSKTL